MTPSEKLLLESIEKWPIARLCPRPWRADTLMIYDADNNVVMHLGGMTYGDRVADPYFLTALADFIVEAVNTAAAQQTAAELGESQTGETAARKKGR